MTKNLIVTIILLSLFGTSYAKVQSVYVTGQLKCNGSPVPNVKVQLYDYDFITADDKMGEDITNDGGLFSVSGSEDEFFSIDPYIVIEHSCNARREGLKTCYRKFRLWIPRSYINKGKYPTRHYGLGTFDLENKYPREKEDCR
uniref:Transthyretin-like family protein n=1 Tax=Parastrongyloides trichosuri TaxID=131310 RepID=A0A0N4ZLX6_PARTI